MMCTTKILEKLIYTVTNGSFGDAYSPSLFHIGRFWILRIFKTKHEAARFEDCHMQRAVFMDTNWEQAHFVNSELRDTIFENANLKKWDFGTSRNYSSDPEKNQIPKAKFSLTGLPGLLTRHDIVST